MEDDQLSSVRDFAPVYFNPRPPGGGRQRRRATADAKHRFQSTSPGWRTTAMDFTTENPYFNPRPPGGGRQCDSPMFSYPFQSTSPGWRTTRLFSNCRSRESISIHVPRVEDDTVLEWMSSSNVKFQSTSPGWRTTDKVRGDGESYSISIHVPRVEDDWGTGSYMLEYAYFNPRPPCGGRLIQRRFSAVVERFQSTSPVWRTTNTMIVLQI